MPSATDYEYLYIYKDVITKEQFTIFITYADKILIFTDK